MDDLLAAIIAAPADDAPREVYADWLQERGDPRGEFIQLQLLAHRDPWALPSWQRMFELENAYGAAWIPSIVRELAVGRINFRRGFVEQLTVDVDAWIARGDALVRATPLVDLVLAQPRLRDALAAPHAAALPSIRISLLRATASDRTTIDRVPPRPHLAELHVGYASLDDAALAAIAQLPAAPRVLDLAGNPLTLDAVRALLASPFAARLHALDLGRIPLGDALVDALAAVPTLRELELPYTQLSPAGVRALSRELEVLDVSGTWFDVATLRALAFPRLRKLVLDHGHVGDDGAIALCEIAEQLPALRWLSLDRCRVGSRGAIAIAECPAFAGLERLILYGARLDNAARTALRERFGARRVATKYHGNL